MSTAGAEKEKYVPMIGPCQAIAVDLRTPDSLPMGTGRFGRRGEPREIELPASGTFRLEESSNASSRASSVKPLRATSVASEAVPRRHRHKAALAFVEETTSKLDDATGGIFWTSDPGTYSTSAGRSVVHCHQHVDGIPVFEAMRTAVFDRHGRLAEVHGDHVSLRERPTLSVDLESTDAVLRAASHLEEEVRARGHKITRYPARILSTPRLPARPTAIHKLPFEDPVMAHLILFELDEGVALGWWVSLSLPRLVGCWDLIVAARGQRAGQVLWCRDNVRHARRAKGPIWLHHPEPQDLRRERRFPAELIELPLVRPRQTLPADFPPPWVDGKVTAGNNARVRAFPEGTFKGRRRQGMIHFEPEALEDVDQRVLNVFFHANYMHDFLYLLGFDEARGNFQKTNFTGSHPAGDRLEVSIESTVPGFASFTVKADGTQPRVRFGRSGANRSTALSTDVVFHECIHGLTDRLVAGDQVEHPMQQSFQSEALDEGICDWFALTLQNYWRVRADPEAAENLVFGRWASGDSPNGLRAHSYEGYPLGFGDLDGMSDEHSAGQVWCASLLSMTRRFGAALEDQLRGYELGWQSVVDALQEMSKTPLSITYLGCRDRVFEALEALGDNSPTRADGSLLLDPAEKREVLEAARAAFHEFDMGTGSSGFHPGFEDVVSS